MKRLALLLTLGVFLAVIFCGCPTKTPTPPPPPVDTMPADTATPTPPPTPPPPPPAPVLTESQFQTVYFDFDKFNLRPDALANLDHNYQLLNEFPDAIIKIEGHCDERGTIEYNVSLGEKRARATMDYLMGLGIVASRISIISYGKERPADPGHNEAAWDKNRRCEFKIVSQ